MARDRDDRDDRDKEDNSKTEVKLKNVRLSYEHIFRPASFQGDDDDKGSPKFSASFIIDPETDQGKDLIDLCYDAIDEAKFKKWGNKPPKLGDSKLALRDDRDTEEYEGKYYVQASSTRRPKVFDIDGKTPLAESDGVIYSGCYVNAIVRFWAQDNKWGKRVNASLEGVQFLRDGEAFGAPGIGDDAFDDESDGKSSSRAGRDGPRRRGRDDDDERGSDRGSRGGDRDRDRGRGRETRDDDERSSRGRDDDERSSRGRDDDERSSRRGRDDDDRGGRDRDRGRDSSDDDRRGRDSGRDGDRRSRRDLV